MAEHVNMENYDRMTLFFFFFKLKKDKISFIFFFILLCTRVYSIMTYLFRSKKEKRRTLKFQGIVFLFTVFFLPWICPRSLFAPVLSLSPTSVLFCLINHRNPNPCLIAEFPSYIFRLSRDACYLVFCNSVSVSGLFGPLAHTFSITQTFSCVGWSIQVFKISMGKFV